jgi:rhodanese-related sulfurtransferase
VKFLIDNIFLVALAAVSGLMLLLPTLRNGKRGGAVTPVEATQMVNQRQAVFVDVRPPAEFAEGRIAQARNVPEAEIEQKAAALPKNKPLVLVCMNGKASAKTVEKFRKQGFSEVTSLAGGIAGWVQAGLPIAKG